MNHYPGGVWPVMLTPFHTDKSIDEKGLRVLVNWYIDSGVDGLFASCQSSEIFDMNLEERVRVAKITVDQAAGRVPVVASGHTDYDIEEQARGIDLMAKTGVQAVILITNRLAQQNESDEVLISNLHQLLGMINKDIKLGFYECPNPYKRVLSLPVLEECVKTGRFYFLKDTCCDAQQIKEKLNVIKGSDLKLYNANTTTLLQSMKDGGAGYSGVMANFHPELYCWLTANIDHPKARLVQDALTIASFIERQYYPVNAKYHLKAIEKLPIETTSRTKDDSELTETFKEEVQQMDELMNEVYRQIKKE